MDRCVRAHATTVTLRTFSAPWVLDRRAGIAGAPLSFHIAGMGAAFRL